LSLVLAPRDDGLRGLGKLILKGVYDQHGALHVLPGRFIRLRSHDAPMGIVLYGDGWSRKPIPAWQQGEGQTHGQDQSCPTKRRGGRYKGKTKRDLLADVR
jgi:hypothetical protein